MFSYKDRPYNDTIAFILEVLHSVGIMTLEKTVEEGSGVFSTRVWISDVPYIGTNGKGFSKEQALASAYGEFMERLQNQALCKFSFPYINRDAATYIYAPDEVLMSSCDEDCFPIYNNCTADDLYQWSLIHSAKEVNSGKWMMFPFWDLKGKRNFLPALYCEHVYGSNGMCAGNTPQEAIVQGICEIFERYVNRIALQKDTIIAPIIPASYYENSEYIRSFLSHVSLNAPDITVEFRDYSLKKGLPVVGMHIYCRQLGYFVKFGAHPVLQIAIERCISELLQGRSLDKRADWMRNFSWGDECSTQFIDIFRNGEGDYPFRLFADKYTYKFSDVWYKGNDISNHALLNYVVGIVQRNNWTLLIRDVSFLKFPSFQVVIPEISQIQIFDKQYIKKMSDIKKRDNLLMRLAKCTVDDFICLSNLMEKLCHGSTQSLAEIMQVPLNQSVLFAQVPGFLMEFYLYIFNKEFEKANMIMDIAYKENSISPLSHAVRDTYEAIINNIEDSDSILKKFHDPILIDIARATIQQPLLFFKLFPVIGCGSCNKCLVAKKCRGTQISALYSKIAAILGKGVCS